jgi:hypothetical protein
MWAIFQKEKKGLALVRKMSMGKLLLTTLIFSLCHATAMAQTTTNTGSSTQSTITIVTVLIGAIVTILGWIVSHYFSQRREGETRRSTQDNEREHRIAADRRADYLRRLEINLNYTEKQIREFYGPLYALIQHIWMTWATKEKIMNELSPNDNEGQQLPYIKSEIDKFIGVNYFFPLHSEIRMILKDRLYLHDGNEMPESFYAYLKHAAMENVQNRLWGERKISTASVHGYRFDNQFAEDVKKGLDEAMVRYNTMIDELRKPYETDASYQSSPSLSVDHVPSTSRAHSGV